MDDDNTVMLVADDDSSYSALVELALKRAHIAVRTICVPDGEDVINYLQHAGTCVDSHAYPVPQLILLDIKMPGMSGLETLVWIRHQPRFKAVPVMLLTSSDDNSDVRRAHELGANFYVVKPCTCDELAHALRHFVDSAVSLSPTQSSKSGPSLDATPPDGSADPQHPAI